MIIDKEFSRELALELLRINAVILRPREPFKWTSGWSSPIYCDNRLTMRYPELRSKIADKLTGYIREHYPSVDVICGTATAGIPHAAWVADRLNKPMGYVRGKAKQHGTANQIEGGVQKDESIILIEDLISTGDSAVTACDVLRYIGAEIKGVLTIFNYGFDQAHERFAMKNLKLSYLTDYETLIQEGLKNGFVKQDDVDLLNTWRRNPDTWPKPVN
jgi:orotate phosphoribosyltransferase